MNISFIKKYLTFFVHKRELAFVILYLGIISLDLRTRLRQSIERDLPYCKLKVYFRSKCRLNNLFRFEDSLEKKIVLVKSIVISAVTARLLIRKKPCVNFIPEQLRTHGIDNLTRKHLKNVIYVISDHQLQCNCIINFHDFSILAKDSNKFFSIFKILY